MKGFHHKNPRKTSPFVTATKHGKLMINKAAMQWLRQRGATHACLLWDAAAGIVAIRPTPPDDPNAYTLTYGDSQVGMNIRNFWRHIGVDPAGQRFAADWNDDMGLLVRTR